MKNNIIMSLCGENNHFEILRKKFHITEFDNKNSKNCFAYIRLVSSN